MYYFMINPYRTPIELKNFYFYYYDKKHYDNAQLNMIIEKLNWNMM